MKMLMPLVILICVAAHASAARPGCCTYDQMEATVGLISSKPGFGVFMASGRVFNDYTNTRSAEILHYISDKFNTRYMVVTRYEKGQIPGKEYTVDLSTGKCSSRPLNQPFQRICIPKHSKQISENFPGLQDDFKVTTFEIDNKDLKTYVSVQDLCGGNCLPVSSTAYTTFGADAQLSNLVVVDAVKGITNSSIFDVPPQCKKVTFAQQPKFIKTLAQFF